MNSKINSKVNPVNPQIEFEIIENPKAMLKKHKIIINGYGRCRSCECRGYISKHDGTHECKNCGHHYDRHRD
jgi:transposase